MVRLLVSVRSSEEAAIALDADVDFLDLKDPAVGALGSLDNATSQQVIKAVNKKKLISATVGECHQSAAALLEVVDEKLALGVDIVKLSLEQFFDDADFLAALRQRVLSQQAKFVGVMFADRAVDLAVIPLLAQVGFYGAMLDTSNKQHSLLATTTDGAISAFIDMCKHHQLVAGLAGSLREENIEHLVSFEPDYLGFRSGVCEKSVRSNMISAAKIHLIRSKLHKHNK